jgi:hypothetical protein
MHKRRLSHQAQSIRRAKRFECGYRGIFFARRICAGHRRRAFLKRMALLGKRVRPKGSWIVPERSIWDLEANFGHPARHGGMGWDLDLRLESSAAGSQETVKRISLRAVSRTGPIRDPAKPHMSSFAASDVDNRPFLTGDEQFSGRMVWRKAWLRGWCGAAGMQPCTGAAYVSGRAAADWSIEERATVELFFAARRPDLACEVPFCASVDGRYD